MATFLRLARQGVRDLAQHPVAQLFTLVAVTLVTFLAGLFLLFLHNLDLQVRQARGEVSFQLYWETPADMQKVRSQWKELSARAGVTRVETFTPEEALTDLSKSLGRELGGLKEKNPLPPTALVSFAASGDDPAWAETTLAGLKALPGVAKVHYNPLEVDLARSWADASRGFAWIVVALLGAVAGVTVGNTIKLSLYSRRDEIEILHLVGATNFYIELPLLAGGAAQGLLGGVAALGLLKLLQTGADAVLRETALRLPVEFLPLSHVGAMLGVIVLVCAASSWVAIRR